MGATGGADEPWPEDPEAGWARIPARLYLDEVETEEKSREWEANSDKAWEVDDLPDLSSSPTLVHNIAGPEMAVHELVDENETPFGELLITSSRGSSTVILGRRAVQAGILLGRSRRCDVGKVLSDRAVSRVHLLIIEIAGVLYAIDTASSNGEFLRRRGPRTGDPPRARRLAFSDRRRHRGVARPLVMARLVRWGLASSLLLASRGHVCADYVKYVGPVDALTHVVQEFHGFSTGHCYGR